MAHEGDMPKGSTIDRSDRPGHIGLVLLLAAVWSARSSACASSGAIRPSPSSSPFSPFSRWPACSSCLRPRSASFSSQGRGPATTSRSSWPTAPGRASPSSTTKGASSTPTTPISPWPARTGRGPHGRAPVHRRSRGLEAIYRLAQAAREQRTGAEEIRLSPSLNGLQEFGWYRVRVRPLPRPGGRNATLWTVADITQERERQEKSSRSSSTPSTISITRRPASSP